MAFTHIYFGSGSQYNNLLRSSLNQLEAGKRDLVNVIATMQTMLDGDGTNISHFNEVDELNSLKFKLTTDSSITAVDSAMTQAFNKFR